MKVNDYVKVVRFTKAVTDENAELLLNNIFPVVKKVTDEEYEVMTSKGRRSVFVDEVEIMVSESTYLDKIDELETEIERLKEELEQTEYDLKDCQEDLMNITGGF